MSRFEITSVGTEGQYSVKEILDLAGIATRLAQITAENAAMAARNIVINAEIVTLEIELASVLLAIENYLKETPPDTVSAAAQTLYSFTVSRSIGKINHQLKINKLKIEGNIKTLAALNAVIAQQDVIHTAVCIDGIDTLTVGQEVGSIDFNRIPADKGAPSKVRIRPGGSAAYSAARDGITRPARAMGGSELFVNQSLMSSAQLFIPRYVAATVDSIDTAENTIGATAFAVGNNHPLTWWEGSGSTRIADFVLSNIPVVYLDCDSAAFIVGDEVVVQYINDQPTVIGFMDDPKPCESGFLAIAEPVDLVASCLFRCDADYEVDWGDGIFLVYSANATASAIPTGTITMRSSNSPTSYRFVTDTYESIDVQQSATITSLYLAHYGLSKMLTLALADTSNVTNFDRFCYGCSGLVSFPTIDASSGLTFVESWARCSGFTTFPVIDISAGTDFTETWSRCSGLTTFPEQIMTSAVTLNQTWVSCSGLVTFNTYDFPAGVNFILTLAACTNLLNLDALNTPLADVFSKTFSGCTGLRVLRGIDTTGASTVPGNSYNNGLFVNCRALSYPDQDTVKQINYGNVAYSDPTRPDMPPFWIDADIYYTYVDTSFAGEDWFVFGDINTSTGIPNGNPNITSVSVAHHDATFAVGTCVLQGGEWVCPIIGGTNGAAVAFTPEDHWYSGSASYLQGMEFYNWPGMTGKEIDGSGTKFVLA